jgi:hypothetical protein
MRWLVALAICAACAGCTGCHDRAEAPPPPNPTMPATEIKRALDACKAYVDKVCGCAKTVAAMQAACELARAYPDAIQVELDVAASPDSSRRDVRQTHGGVRNIAKTCIEESAKLPAAGCP